MCEKEPEVELRELLTFDALQLMDKMELKHKKEIAELKTKFINLVRGYVCADIRTYNYGTLCDWKCNYCKELEERLNKQGLN